MNSRVAAFINNHEEEIDSNDFHSVFTAAYSELNNDDTRVLYNDLSDTFGEEEIQKQRESALYFIVNMLTDDFDPKRKYSFGHIYAELMRGSILGLSSNEFARYLRENAEEFDLKLTTVNGQSVYTKKEI